MALRRGGCKARLRDNEAGVGVLRSFDEAGHDAFFAGGVEGDGELVAVGF